MIFQQLAITTKNTDTIHPKTVRADNRCMYVCRAEYFTCLIGIAKQRKIIIYTNTSGMGTKINDSTQLRSSWQYTHPPLPFPKVDETDVEETEDECV